MSKFHNDFINNNTSTLENNDFNNQYMTSDIDLEGKQDNYIKDDNLSTKSEEKLSESNASTENNDNDRDEYVENLIDLSFLDMGSNEPSEKNININNFIHNYNLMNNAQNALNKNIPQKNPNFSNKSNPKNKIKKYIDKRFLINLMDIKTNKEQRTTIRMMNIPSYFRPLDLAKKIDEKFGISPQKENRVYDFIYIPFKESKKNEGLINAGYAFINFVHPKHILKFYSFFQGKHLKLKTSGKVCIITFASRQGVNIKNNNFGQSDNDKYMFFSDTKNHFQLLTD